MGITADAGWSGFIFQMQAKGIRSLHHPKHTSVLATDPTAAWSNALAAPMVLVGALVRFKAVSVAGMRGVRRVNGDIGNAPESTFIALPVRQMCTRRL